MMSIQYNSKLDAERPGCRYYRERDLRPKALIGKIDAIIMNTCDSDANPIDSGCLNGIDLRPFTQNWSFDTGILNNSRLDADLPEYSASGCLFLRPFPVNGQLMMSIQYNSKLDAERPGNRYD